MQLRQEQIVFGLTALLVAGLGMRAGTPAGARASLRSSSAGLEAPRFDAPQLPADIIDSTALTRAMLSAPRDTRPLDPLEFDTPELEPLPTIFPPPPTAPAPEHWARTLQRATSVTDLIDLFDRIDGQAADAAAPSNEDPADALAGAQSFKELDPTERLEAIEAFRGVYDWIRTSEVDLSFGRIENEARFGLALSGRAEEPIEFLELDPFSGEPRFSGQPAIVYERERVLEWGFADTLVNRIEQRNAELGGELSAGRYVQALALAEEALAARLEVPHAIDIARELYARAAEFRADDAEPLLGLARVERAAFDLDAAFAQYTQVVERFPARAEAWIGMGEIQAALLLDDAAEASLRKAVSLDRGSWRASAALGKFLLATGRANDAREVLDRSVRDLPTDMALRAERASVRLDHADALLRTGDIDAAAASYSKALEGNTDSGRAVSGVVACRLAGAPEAAVPAELSADGDGAALDAQRLLSSALLALDAGDFERARSELERAAALMPLDPAPARRGLSYLAQRTGNNELALSFVEAALAAEPDDVWSLYQRGRLLIDVEDYAGAAASLRAALERASDFEEALMSLGLVELRRARYDDAVRLFERAAELSARRSNDAEERADAVAMAGLAKLQSGGFLDASETFGRALALDGDSLIARAGQAWCVYRLGDPEEALIQLRNLDDLLRAQPEEHPYRVWANAQITRLDEHLSKDIWSDRFEYTTIGNGWLRDESAGPTAALIDGVLHLEGNFSSSGEMRFYREYPASEFLGLAASVKIGPESTVRGGLFVARELDRSSGARLQAFAGLARSRDGAPQVREVGGAGEDPGWIDLLAAEFPFPADTWVRLEIQRRGEGSDARVDFFMDGVPVLENVSMSGLGRGNAAVRVGFFAEGETGRVAAMQVDNVEVTRQIK